MSNEEKHYHKKTVFWMCIAIWILGIVLGNIIGSFSTVQENKAKELIYDYQENLNPAICGFGCSYGLNLSGVEVTPEAAIECLETCSWAFGMLEYKPITNFCNSWLEE